MSESRNGPLGGLRNRTLKEQILEELAAWSAECSDIAREILKTRGSEEEASAHERRAEDVEDLLGRLRGAVIAERGPKLTRAEIDVYTEDLTSFPPEYVFRYEASCTLPFDSTAQGAIVGYSDGSEEDAARELTAALGDLSLDPETLRLVDATTGERRPVPSSDTAPSPNEG